MKKADVEKKENAEKEMLVYIGPPLQKGKYKAIDTFLEIPKDLEGIINEFPALKTLFIPVSKYPAVKVKLARGEGVYKNVMLEVVERGY